MSKVRGDPWGRRSEDSMDHSMALGQKLRASSPHLVAQRGAGVTPQQPAAPVKKTESLGGMRSDIAPPTARVNGVSTIVLENNGGVVKQADSGLKVTTTGSDQTIELPTGESFLWNDGGLTSRGGESTSLGKTPDGLTLISFQDKEQNTVQVQPESLTFEVLNKAKNLAQVYHPDGHQEVVAFGRFRGPDGKVSEYEHHAVYSPEGSLVEASGFHGLDVAGNKLSFDLGTGVRTERTLARPLPGQPAFTARTESAPDMNPSPRTTAPPALTIFEEEAPQLSTPMAASAKSLSEGSAPSSPFGSLTNIRNDFFASAEADGVAFDETTSGLVMRQEGDTRAYLLPNGDAFRTDGKEIELLGESPRAKNARIVTEGDAQLLAYSDADGNRHQLDINTGDYEVSNRQGTLTQGLKADGTKEVSVRGTYTSESGKPQQYLNTAAFGASGTLLSKGGFDDLKIAGDRLEFTLPNGVASDRTLIEPSAQTVHLPKKLVLSEGLAAEWGGALALADEFLSGGAAVAAPLVTPPVAPSIEAASVPAPVKLSAEQIKNQTVTSPSGVSRGPLEDGSGMTTHLPNGLRFVDGSETYGLDASGNRLNVFRTETAGETGAAYLLSMQAPDGTGYSISSSNLDLIVASADGKVLQSVGATGKVVASVTDGANKHLYEVDPFTGANSGTPGTRLDPRNPRLLLVEGSPAGGYELPYPLFGGFPSSAAPGQSTPVTPGSGGQPMGPGSFSGDGGPNTGGLPGSYQQFDPVAAQFQRMDRENKMMMMSTVGMGLTNSMSMMLFSPMGMF